MKRSYLHHALSGLAVLFAMTACVLPGQATPPQAIQPTIGLDANAIATAVASTAQAAATQTASSELFAPSEKDPITEKLPEGGTKYTDYEGGFEISFPVGWLALIPNSDEFNAALKKEGAANSMLRNQMISDLAAYEPEFERVYGYILRPDIGKKNLILGFSKLEWDPQDALSIDSITMGEMVKGLEAPDGIPGFRADTVQLHEDTQLKMIEIGGPIKASDGQGGNISFYITLIFFKPTSNSTVRLSFTFLQEYRAQIAPDVKSVRESIKLIEPQQ
jgi:hypothetical protein